MAPAPEHIKVRPPSPTLASRLAILAGHVFSFGYGTLTLSVFWMLAYTKKSAFRKLSARDKKELATARDNLWNLSKHPHGLTHRFTTLKDGTKLHYVVSVPQKGIDDNTGLVIFLHGFPDSWILWQHHLRHHRLTEKAVLLAVDLPGYGGSDGLPHYGPNEVLNALTEFILRAREDYLDYDEDGRRGHGRVLVVAHDWGALLAFRLAAEAPQLADRFILSNAVHPPLFLANLKDRVMSTSQMLHTWFRTPSKFRLLSKAFANIRPLLKQVLKSGYIFAFNLPFPMVSSLGSIGDFWLLRFLNAVTVEPDPDIPLEGKHGAETLASSVGPSEAECCAVKIKDPSNGSTVMIKYSDSVRQRARSGGFVPKLGLYCNGCFSQPWEKTLENLWDLQQLLTSQQARRRSSSSSGWFDMGPEGSIKAPTTVIWGKNDVAIENCLALEGFGDYFGARGSQLLVVSQCGHWTPVDKQGAPIFEEVIEWALQGEHGTLRMRLGDNFPLAKIQVEK